MIRKIYKIGSWYVFKIVKIINIPCDESYYILKDIHRNMFLLPVKYYYNYNLKLNRIIICRIDKVNCTGRVFLEPVHPYYYEGEIHDFKFCKIAQIINKNKILKQIMILKDIFGNEAFINDFHTDNQVHDIIKCKIERIKKGKLFLSKI